ncbi:MAG: hypothetical protein R2865_14320 [Deinococcales bacterium]
MYPAAYAVDGLLAVGLEQNSSNAWQPASFSNQGSFVEISALAVNLISSPQQVLAMLAREHPMLLLS